jgi:hypothetical protein
MTFFSLVGAITVLCGTINNLSLLCVVPFVNTTVFPFADCTLCTRSLHLFSVPFLNDAVLSILTLSPGFKSVTNPFSLAFCMFKCMTCILFLGSDIASLSIILSDDVCGVLLYCSIRNYHECFKVKGAYF